MTILRSPVHATGVRHEDGSSYSENRTRYGTKVYLVQPDKESLVEKRSALEALCSIFRQSTDGLRYGLKAALQHTAIAVAAEPRSNKID